MKKSFAPLQVKPLGFVRHVPIAPVHITKAGDIAKIAAEPEEILLHRACKTRAGNQKKLYYRKRKEHDCQPLNRQLVAQAQNCPGEEASDDHDTQQAARCGVLQRHLKAYGIVVFHAVVLVKKDDREVEHVGEKADSRDNRIATTRHEPDHKRD